MDFFYKTTNFLNQKPIFKINKGELSKSTKNLQNIYITLSNSIPQVLVEKRDETP